jgi:hypothetical protein
MTKEKVKIYKNIAFSVKSYYIDNKKEEVNN